MAYITIQRNGINHIIINALFSLFPSLFPIPVVVVVVASVADTEFAAAVVVVLVVAFVSVVAVDDSKFESPELVAHDFLSAFYEVFLTLFITSLITCSASFI